MSFSRGEKGKAAMYILSGIASVVIFIRILAIVLNFNVVLALYLIEGLTAIGAFAITCFSKSEKLDKLAAIFPAFGFLRILYSLKFTDPHVALVIFEITFLAAIASAIMKKSEALCKISLIIWAIWQTASLIICIFTLTGESIIRICIRVFALMFQENIPQILFSIVIMIKIKLNRLRENA